MAAFVLKDFTGIDESQGTTNAQPNVAAAAHNISTDLGRLTVADGYALALPPVPGDEALRRVMRFDVRGETGTTTHVLVATDTRVLVWLPGAEPWEAEEPDDTPRWHTLYDGALSGEWSYIVWEQLSRDIIVLANGADPVKKWYGDTETLEDLEGLPTENEQTVRYKYLALHKERLWGAGYPMAPDMVYYSQAFDPEKWGGDLLQPIAGGGVIPLPQHDGSSVAGLKTVFGDVLIFRTNNAIRIYGDNPDNYQIVTVRGAFGPIANESIVDAGTVCWFWTADGLGYYDGMSTGLVDDRRIGSIVRRVNSAAYTRVNGIVKGNRLYMALPLDDAEQCTAMLEYDAGRQAYMLHEGVAAQDFVFSDAARDTLYMAIGSAVCAMGGGTLGEAPIAAKWVSPWFDLDHKTSIKAITRIETHGQLSKPNGGPNDMAAVTLTVQTENGMAAKRFEMRNGREGRMGVSLLLAGTRFRVMVENVNGSLFALDGGIALEVTEKRGAF